MVNHPNRSPDHLDRTRAELAETFGIALAVGPIEFADVDGGIQINQDGGAQIQMRIEASITSKPGYRLRPDVLAAHIQRGIRRGDVVRWRGESLVEYHCDRKVTMIFREYRSDPAGGILVEVGRKDKVLPHNQCVELFIRAALEAHANAINAPGGVHHAFTGVAYNPTPRI